MMKRDLLTKAELALLLGVSARTLERWRTAGTFPEPVALSPRVIRYRRADVEAHLGLDLHAEAEASGMTLPEPE